LMVCGRVKKFFTHVELRLGRATNSVAAAMYSVAMISLDAEMSAKDVAEALAPHLGALIQVIADKCFVVLLVAGGLSTAALEHAVDAAKLGCTIHDIDEKDGCMDLEAGNTWGHDEYVLAERVVVCAQTNRRVVSPSVVVSESGVLADAARDAAGDAVVVQ